MALGLLLLVSAAGAYSFRERIFIAVGTFLVVDEPLTPSDAILVLAGELPERMLEAVDLFHRGLAPRILLCPIYASRRFQKRLAVYDVHIPRHYSLSRKLAVKMGVPEEAIVVLKEIESTMDEAREALRYLEKRNLRSLIVVTSQTHTKRARVIFDSIIGSKVRVQVRATPYDDFDPKRWWHHRIHQKEVFYEYIKHLNWRLIGL